MPLDQTTLTKGQLRKLSALRKSIGDDLADPAFTKWLKRQSKSSKPTTKADPVVAKIQEALKPYENDKTFNLGRGGYKVTRARGRGVKGGFSVMKIIAQ